MLFPLGDIYDDPTPGIASLVRPEAVKEFLWQVLPHVEEAIGTAGGLSVEEVNHLRRSSL
jgi:hypothetical protein